MSDGLPRIDWGDEKAGVRNTLTLCPLCNRCRICDRLRCETTDHRMDLFAYDREGHNAAFHPEGFGD